MDSLPGNRFNQKVRIRICGVPVDSGKILLVRHQGLGKLGWYWSPPGGGVEFGESTAQTLVREFQEETGLAVSPGPFLRFHEHIDNRFHALELFFQITSWGGVPVLGSDPELDGQAPMLDGLDWFSREDLLQLPKGAYHPAVLSFLEP